MNELSDIGPCIVMEYIDGMTLREFLSQNKLTGKNAHKIISDICHALNYVHSKQIIHRDLKPENILITYNGQNVKLIDFGLADSDDYEILKIPAGTKRYIAPEQSDKNCTLDNRADIFSLGVIIEEMNEKLHNIQLKKIAKRCMEPDRNKRFDTVSDILQEMDGTDIAKKLWIIITVIFAAVAIAFAIYLSFRSAPAPLPAKNDFPSDTLHQQQTPSEIITEEELHSANR
jgi:serine/threonine protein kinase